MNNPNLDHKGKYQRTCDDCGEIFYTSSKVRNLCYKEHYHTCPICGKSFKVSPYPPQSITCSKKCASEWKARKLEEKYGEGIRSTLQLDDVRRKCEETSLKNWGTANPMSSDIIKQRRKNACISKYGEDFQSQFAKNAQETWRKKYGDNYRKIFYEHSQETWHKKYGVSHITQSDEFKKLSQASCKERYGTDFYTQSLDFRQKAINTWTHNYGEGMDNPLKSHQIRARIQQTCLAKYGTKTPGENSVIKEKIRNTNIINHANKISNESRRKEYLLFKLNPGKYLEDALQQNNNIGLSQLAYLVGYSDPTILYEVVHQYGLENLVDSHLSVMEQEVLAFIQTIDSNIKIQQHDRSIIAPYELDFYLPEFNLAIECNPTATHNSTYVLANMLGDVEAPALDTYYHQRKSILCRDKGIFLFHIFGYEWHYNRDIIQSMIRNLLHADNYKYYARNLTLRECSYQESKEFLDANHRQGACQASIRLGLYSNNMLVSLMTFGPLRPTMGKSKYNEDVCELSRFCNLKNTSVVGGASKLFKHFLTRYNTKTVVSFSDVAHTYGNLYSILGFRSVGSISEPGYLWVNQCTDLYFNRVACQKKNLRKLFNDPSIDVVNKTEDQIMSEHGFVKVYDSGLIRWEYTNEVK